MLEDEPSAQVQGSHNGVVEDGLADDTRGEKPDVLEDGPSAEPQGAHHGMVEDRLSINVRGAHHDMVVVVLHAEAQGEHNGVVEDGLVGDGRGEQPDVLEEVLPEVAQGTHNGVVVDGQPSMLEELETHIEMVEDTSAKQQKEQNETIKVEGDGRNDVGVEGVNQGRRMVLLVEPKKDEAPTRRRRGKDRKRSENLRQGTIHKFISNQLNMKECMPKTTSGSTLLRKRKWLETVEDLTEDYSTKSRRLMVENDQKSSGRMTNSGALSPIMGAKSVSRREATQGQCKGAVNLVDNEKDEKKTPQGFGHQDRNT